MNIFGKAGWGVTSPRTDKEGDVWFKWMEVVGTS